MWKKEGPGKGPAHLAPGVGAGGMPSPRPAPLSPPPPPSPSLPTAGPRPAASRLPLPTRLRRPPRPPQGRSTPQTPHHRPVLVVVGSALSLGTKTLNRALPCPAHPGVASSPKSPTSQSDRPQSTCQPCTVGGLSPAFPILLPRKATAGERDSGAGRGSGSHQPGGPP